MSASLTGHAVDRALGRLADAGIDGRAVLDRAARVAAKVRDDSAAILMVRLPAIAGDAHGDFYGRASNGDDVWAIIRRNKVVTLMLRRSAQPATPDALRVDRVYRMKGAVA
jgi:hypothetical protein